MPRAGGGILFHLDRIHLASLYSTSLSCIFTNSHISHSWETVSLRNRLELKERLGFSLPRRRLPGVVYRHLECLSSRPSYSVSPLPINKCTVLIETVRTAMVELLYLRNSSLSHPHLHLESQSYDRYAASTTIYTIPLKRP